MFLSKNMCWKPRKPMNISTRNPVMSPIMLVHKHRGTCSAISTETRAVLHNCSHCPIVEISGHEVSFLPQYRDMFAASTPHFKVSSPPLSYRETSSGRPSFSPKQKYSLSMFIYNNSQVEIGNSPKFPQFSHVFPTSWGNGSKMPTSSSRATASWAKAIAVAS